MNLFLASILIFFTLSFIQKGQTFQNFSLLEIPVLDTPELMEQFIDSTNIGQKGKNKIELKKFKISESVFVIINFYTRSSTNKWKLKQEFEFPTSELADLSVHLSDFNNDRFRDMTYQSALAARGANEVRNLFVYNKAKDTLTYIKNSENYPNMQYNRYLDCIDAMLFYGSTATVFAKIRGDSLIEFAMVEINTHITVSIVDKSGNRKIIRKIKNRTGEEFVRYRNYNPLQPY